MEMEHLILKSLKMSSQTCFILNSRFVLIKESARLIGLDSYSRMGHHRTFTTNPLNQESRVPRIQK